MSIITTMLKQIAVYWAPSGSDDYGKPTYSNPVEIKCRWEDAQEVYVTLQGENKVSRSKVFLASDVEPKGILMLGTLSDITDESNPRNNGNAGEIGAFDKTPNLRATEFLRIAYL